MHIIADALHLPQHPVRQSCIVCLGRLLTFPESGQASQQQPHLSMIRMSGSVYIYSGAKAAPRPACQTSISYS